MGPVNAVSLAPTTKLPKIVVVRRQDDRRLASRGVAVDAEGRLVALHRAIEIVEIRILA